MISFSVLCLAAVLFVIVLDRSGLIGLSLQVVADGRAAVQVMADGALDDDAKEAAIQRMSGRMLYHFACIAGLTLICLAGPTALIAATVSTGLTDLNTISATAVSLPFLALNAAAFAGVIFWKYRT